MKSNCSSHLEKGIIGDSCVKLMTHMVCWYPTLSESETIFKTLYKYSQYIEIQFPFSDPIWDGPIIEKANKEAIKNWMTTKKCFEFIEKSVGCIPCGCPDKKSKILIMTYYNIIFNYWVEKFILKAKELGVYGFIIPDIPYDEDAWKQFRKLCRENDLVCTELATPSTPKNRLEEIAELKPELIYAISQNMTTGSVAQFWKEFEEYIERLKSIFLSPIGGEYPKGERGLTMGGAKIWVWFWVKTKSDVEKICKQADFAIIGSEFIKKFNSWGIQELEDYLDEITN